MLQENNYVTVDLDALQENMSALRRKAQVRVMAVVKADAYGHGAVQVAQALQAQCDFFGVATLSEALELRRHDIHNPILLLGPTPVSGFDRTVAEDIRPTLTSLEEAQALSEAALRQGKTAPFHIAIDTGMSRIGLQPTKESAQICKEMAQLPGVQAEGIFSHYATADMKDLTAAREQSALFDSFLQTLRQLGVEIPLPHMDNSAGLLNFSNHYAMVRAGIVLYGQYPSTEVDSQQLPVKPVLSWYSRISQVKTLPAGRAISYGGTYVTQGETVVATVAVGYGDGYRRSLSGNFYVLIRGKRAPILGRVCMDQLMVDVTHIPHVTPGDRVVLLGSDGDETITADALSAAAGSFPYELLCGISRRVPRCYLRHGETVQIAHYLLDTP